MRRPSRCLILASSLLLIACGKQGSSAWLEPSYGPALAYELSDQGKTYRYTEQAISPAYRLTGIPLPEESQLTRPELVLVRYVHAVTQTFDWNMSNALWDPVSRAAFEAEMAKSNETPEDRVRARGAD